jgi:peptide/nickel transport system ATP-binding protein/oligopeptide transport system ATP-binding protein
LAISSLRTVFRTSGGDVAAVDGVDISVGRGRTLGIVGESGCGKSVLSLSVMRLVPPPGRIATGQIMFDGRNLLDLSLAQMRDIRGNRIAMIFQEPMTSLNPVFTVGDQITEAMRAHDRAASATALRSRAIAALQRVRIPAPERRFDEYPHQMSGGMRQRVMIAMALACEPDLLIADEPTTALDVTVQAQILDLLRELQAQTGMAIILITHDLGIVAEMADEVAVMYAGRVVERAPGPAIFDDPQHPYTLGLLGSIPKIEENRDRLLAIEGTVPAPFDLPQGCRFHPRCVFADAACTLQDPELRLLAENHRVACIRAPVEALTSCARFWRSKASPGTSTSSVVWCLARWWAWCARSMASHSQSIGGKRWRWSESPVAASQPPHGLCCGSSIRLQERSTSKAPTSPSCAAIRCVGYAGGCRSCFRIRLPR